MRIKITSNKGDNPLLEKMFYARTAKNIADGNQNEQNNLHVKAGLARMLRLQKNAVKVEQDFLKRRF